MLRENKSEQELRFELLLIGLVLISGAMMYVIFWRTSLRPMLLFIPGLILLGGVIYQDLQVNWHSGWLMYVLAIIVVATGLAGIVNNLLGGYAEIPWLIIAIVELGAILLAKALYDPTI